jgi:DNA segregation ATPase FtsK/SpoIIIE, S-DNA-T family
VSVELSVADVRSALVRHADTDVAGAGEAATLLLGRLFHEVFADLVSLDSNKSGLRVIVEAGEPSEQQSERLLEHTWRQLIAPRLRRHVAALQTSSDQVLVMWRATRRLASWLVDVVVELSEQSAYPRGSWMHLADALRSEVPLACELREPGWTDSVRLVGIADGILRSPRGSSYCAIELKLGRCAPVIDLGQAALYHLIMRRTTEGASKSALALLRFSPELEERLVDAAAIGDVEARLLDLIGELASVKRAMPPPPEKKARAKGSASTGAVTSPDAQHPASEKIGEGRHAPNANDDRLPVVERVPAKAPDEPTLNLYEELAKRLVRAYREQGVGIEVREPPLVGPRFLRFALRLGSGMRIDAVKKRTVEVQHRLELRTEPLVTQEAGRLFIDLERPDPETVPFTAITPQLPSLDPLSGSAKIPVGVDAGGRLHFADLSSSGRSHLLAAGTTGSGKSEWLRMMLAGLIASNTPETLRVVTIDPKLAAFADLERSPFLWKKDAWWIPGGDRAASEVFADLIEEMERRYQLTRTSGADNLRDHVLATGKPLARIVCVCDEYFALISQNKEERRQIEEAVALLGAKARAAGIHLVLATQQPSRAVITGIIQANLPCRVALALSSHIESNMILGARGAERLTGSGDLLYKDLGDPIRLQAPYLSAAERAHWFKR